MECKLDDGSAAGDGDIELGDDTLDLVSLPDPPSTSRPSSLWLSCSGRDSNCLVIPYRTSATSISISSWLKDADLEIFGGRCLAPLIGF